MWEYKTIELITLEPMAIEKVLNDLGKANWELISHAFADQGTTGFAVPRRSPGILIAAWENLRGEKPPRVAPCFNWRIIVKLTGNP